MPSSAAARRMSEAPVERLGPVVHTGQDVRVEVDHPQIAQPTRIPAPRASANSSQPTTSRCAGARNQAAPPRGAAWPPLKARASRRPGRCRPRRRAAGSRRLRTVSTSAPSAAQDLAGDALFLARETEEDVLGADVVVAERLSLAQRQLERLLRAWGERDLPRSSRHRRRPGRRCARPARAPPRSSRSARRARGRRAPPPRAAARAAGARCRCTGDRARVPRPARGRRPAGPAP